MSSSVDLGERLRKEVEKDLGEGVLVPASLVGEERRHVIPFCPTVDLITGGGVVEGSWVGLTGPPKAGKSAWALTLAAQAQREENGARPVYYGAVEGRIPRVQMRGTRGLDMRRVEIIRSHTGAILNAQQFLGVFEKILRTVPRACLIIDSISCLCDEREMSGGAGTETRGSGAKLFSQFLHTMAGVVPVMGSVVVGITHLICNTSGFGKHLVERAARAWGYQCDYQLAIKSSAPWVLGKNGDSAREVGKRVRWDCFATPLGPPGRSMESYLRYGVGYDRIYECLTLGQACGLVVKKGSWFTIPWADQRPDAPEGGWKFQGAEKLYRALGDHPQLADSLCEQVLERVGGRVDQPDDDDECEG